MSAFASISSVSPPTPDVADTRRVQGLMTLSGPTGEEVTAMNRTNKTIGLGVENAAQFLRQFRLAVGLADHCCGQIRFVIGH